MLLAELITTCSHGCIAEAAVASIGAPFRSRIARRAHTEGLTLGEYAARAVRAFRDHASEADWDELAQVCAGQDMPILCGLHHILEAHLEGADMPGVNCAWSRPHGDMHSGACCA